MSIIEQREVYGYELYSILRQSGFDYVREGSIYPLLLRMQREEWIAGYMKSNDRSNGPPRKYYRMTEEGRAELERFRQQWHRLQTSVDQVLTSGELAAVGQSDLDREGVDG